MGKNILPLHLFSRLFRYKIYTVIFHPHNAQYMKGPCLMRQKLLAMQAAQGDRSALESLVRQYYDAIYNYIFQRVRSRETAEDLTQDVFVKLTAWSISTKHSVSIFRSPRMLRPISGSAGKMKKIQLTPGGS